MSRRLRDILQVAVVFGSLTYAAHWLFPSSGNPPAGYTGSPFDGNTCQSCHNGSNTANSANLTISGPTTWTEGVANSYTVTLTAGSRFGFEATVENGSSKQGSFTAVSNTSVLGGSWIGHNNASGNNSFQFQWNPPSSAGAGTVTLYVIGLAANGNFSADSGDNIHRKTLSITYVAPPPPAPTLNTLSPDFGAVNEQITLSGSNFTTTAGTVNFGATACTGGCIVSWGNTSIVAKVPSGVANGAITVTVTNANGTSGGQSFTAITGAPTVASISPNRGSSTDTARTFSLGGTNFSKTPTSVKLKLAGQTDITASAVSVANTTSLTGTFNLQNATSGQWNVEVTNPDTQAGTFNNAFSLNKTPSAPTLLVPVTTSSGSIAWSWDPLADNATGYRLTDASLNPVSGILSALTTTYNETGLQANAQVSRRVEAFNFIGSAASNTVSTYTFANAPTAPQAGTFTNNSASLNWASDNAAGTNYVAELATNSFTLAAATNTATVTQTTATFTGLQGNSTYYLRVKTRSANNVDTAYTSEVFGVTLANAPTDPVVTGATLNTQSFAWTGNNPPDTSYIAELSANSGFGTIHRTSTTQNTSVTYTSIPTNTNYFFRVRAVSRQGIETSNSVTISTPTLADAPTNSSAAPVSPTSAQLSWNRATNPPGSTLYVAQAAADAGFTSPQTQNTTAEQATFTGLTSNATWFFRVRAENLAGIATAFDATASTVTFAAAPTAPLVGVIGLNEMNFSWSTTNPSDTLYVAEISSGPFAVTPVYRTSSTFNTNAQYLSVPANTTYYFRVKAVSRLNLDTAYTVEIATPTLADVPTGSTAIGTSVNSAEFGWSRATNPPDKTTYVTQLASDSAFTQVVQSAATTAQEKEFTSLTPDTSYYFRVRAQNHAGIATAFDAAVTTLTYAAAPFGPATQTLGTNSLTFTWDSLNPAGTKYRAELATGSFASSPVHASQDATVQNATFSSLTANTTYHLRVKALGQNGVETAYTTEIARVTLAIPPTGSTVISVTTDTAVFAWTLSNPVGTVYQVQQSQDGVGFSGAQTQFETGNDVTFTGLTPNTSNFFRVRAVNHAGTNSAFDTAQSTVTLAADPGTPVAVLRGSDSIKIQWATNGNASDTRYAAEVSLTDFGAVLQSSVTVLGDATFSALTPSTSYYFRVKAIDRVNRETAYTAAALGRTTSVNLSAPNAPVGTALGISSIAWTWDAVPNAVKYNIYAGTNTQAGAHIAEGVVGLTFDWTGLSPNLLYSLRVSAVNGDNEEGAPSAAGSTYTHGTAPTGTNGVSLSSSSNRVQWTATAASGHSVERSETSGSGFAVIATSATVGGASLFDDTGLDAGTTYFYRVRGYNALGVATPYDAEASTRTRLADVATPAGLAGSPQTPASINYTWAPQPGTIRYALYSTTNTAPGAAFFNPPGTSFIRTGLSANTAYGVRIAGVNGDGLQGPMSAAINTFTLALPPTGTSALSVSSTSIKVSWSTAAASGYSVERSLVSGSGFTQVASSSTLGTTAEFTDSGLTPTTTYYYRVRGFNGDSVATAYDTESSTRTRFAPLGAPAGVTVTALGVSSLSVTWNLLAGSNSYNLYTSTNGVLAQGLTAALFNWTGLSANTLYGAKVASVNGDGVEQSTSAVVSAHTAAQTPGALTLQTLTAGSIKVDWTAVTANGYALERSLTTDNGFTVAASSAILGASATTYTDTGLSANTTYFYRLKASNGGGFLSIPGPEASTRTFIAAPPVPTGLAGSALGVSSISWNWSAAAGAATYSLLHAGTTEQVPSGTTHASTSLSPNTQYSARVAAVNADGLASAQSAAVLRFTHATTATGLNVIVLSSTSLRVTWTNAGATSYTVERSLDSGANFSQVGSGGAGLQHTDNFLTASTTYFYRVKSVNGDGVASPASAEASGVTSPPALGVPALAGHAVSTASIAWTWTYSGPTVANFNLYTDTMGVVASLGGSATYYLETGLAARTAYKRYLQAQNSTVSSFSSTVTVATPDVSAEVPAGSSVTLTAADGATKVDIPAGAFNGNSGQASLSLDPVTSPLIPETPTFILAANAALPDTLKGPATSIREFVAIVDGQRFSGTFSQPVTISIPYPDADNDGFVDGVSPPLVVENLAVYHLNETTQQWEAVAGSTVNRILKVVRVSVTHFSIFTVLGSPAATDLTGMKVYPSPWRPGSGGAYDAAGIKFKGLTDNATIKIFTVAGEHVRTLIKVTADGDEKVWDGRNTSGDKVASGVYLYRVSSSVGNRMGRVAVIR